MTLQLIGWKDQTKWPGVCKEMSWTCCDEAQFGCCQRSSQLSGFEYQLQPIAIIVPLKAGHRTRGTRRPEVPQSPTKFKLQSSVVSSCSRKRASSSVGNLKSGFSILAGMTCSFDFWCRRSLPWRSEVARYP